MSNESTGPAFEPIKPTDGNTYAARMERLDQTAFYVSTDGKVVAFESPYVTGPAFMSNAEAAAAGRELLKVAGTQAAHVAMPRKPTLAMLCALAGRTGAQMDSQSCIEAGERYDAMLAMAAGGQIA